MPAAFQKSRKRSAYDGLAVFAEARVRIDGYYA